MGIRVVIGGSVWVVFLIDRPPCSPEFPEFSATFLLRGGGVPWPIVEALEIYVGMEGELQESKIR